MSGGYTTPEGWKPSTKYRVLLAIKQRIEQHPRRLPFRLTRAINGALWAETPCNGKHSTSVVYGSTCDACEPIYAANHPQGWAYYPGDTCKHGRYVGGCGYDLMCAECEGL
jgi:hypothetical protein